MSLHLWYEDNPCSPKYLQISHMGLQRYSKNDTEFDEFRRKIHDHHAQPVTKDGMFILEQFFSGETLEYVAKYLVAKGFKLKDNYHDLEGECIVEGYDGVLIHWSW